MSLKLVKEIKSENIILRNKEIDATDLDGEKVMMNLDKGQYFMMNEVASRIWDIIESEVVVSSIVNTLMSEYEVDANTCKETVLDFLKEMQRADLITVA